MSNNNTADMISLLRTRDEKEIARLREAIRKHRDWKGDNRCWLDDVELYEVLGEPVPDAQLPPKPQFLESCSRYWELRQASGCSHDNMPTIAKHEAEIARLRKGLEFLADEAHWPLDEEHCLRIWSDERQPYEVARDYLEGKA